MGYALQEILGYTAIMEHAEAVKLGVPNPFPKELFTITADCVGDSARFIQLNRNRSTSRLGQYGAPAVRTSPKPINSQDIKLLHSIEELPLDPIVLGQLRAFDSYEHQQKGMEAVAVFTEDFIERFQVLRIATTGLFLANGRVGFDSTGNLLTDANYSSAAEQVTWNMPAANQNQLAGIISARWDLNNTDIPNQLRQLKMTAAQTNGYELTKALYGRNIPSYFVLNDYVVDYMAREGNMRGEYLASADMPGAKFMGLEWMPTYMAFWDQDQTQTTPSPQQIWPNDLVTFLPNPDKKWWSMALGSYPVPKSLNLTANAESALANVEIIHGMAGFGYISYPPAPVGVSMIYLDTFLPTPKVQTVIWQAVTVF